MRLFAVCLLVAGMLPASPIGFSGVFTQGLGVHSISLTGDNGFALVDSLNDLASFRAGCGNPCDASGVFRTINGENPWTSSWGGLSTGPGSYSTGALSFTAAPFSPAPHVSVPVTVSGEIAVYLMGGSALYDLAISGSGMLDVSLEPQQAGFVIDSVSARISGTAAPALATAAGDPVPTPEPGTAGLLLLGLLSALPHRRWLLRRR